MVAVEARISPIDRVDAFDISEFGDHAAVLRLGDSFEHVLIGDGFHHIQLEVRGRSLLDGPVSLHYDLRGFEGIEAKLLTLQRLVALRRLGRFPRSLFPPERRVGRWAIALRALDASRAGLRPRESAAALFGEETVRRDWDGVSDYLRSRVRRAIAAGECLVSGGYLDLLRGSAPGGREPAESKRPA